MGLVIRVHFISPPWLLKRNKTPVTIYKFWFPKKCKPNSSKIFPIYYRQERVCLTQDTSKLKNYHNMNGELEGIKYFKKKVQRTWSLILS
jgi:hypothetical protein